MNAEQDPRPRVLFAVRYPAGDGRFRYQRVSIDNYAGSGYAPLAHPPAPGDLITLWDADLHRRGLPQPEGGPVFRVTDRLWSHASYGSMAWPHGSAEPRQGPLTDVIVEPAAGGPYRDETDICENGTCEAVWVDGAWWTPPGAGEPEPHEHAPYRSGAGT